MAKSVLHVVPHDQDWAVKREGHERPSSTHGTQRDAIEAARELAKEQDDIVIHRPDGTIRERVTYSGTSNGNGHTSERETERDMANTTRVEARDVASVGTRVRWSAVFAGVIVAFAVLVTLNLLAFAIGLSSVDHMSGRSFAVTASIITTVILIGAMFLGGFVVSRSTVGEQPSEGVTYGVLVWGTMTLFLLVAGFGLGVGSLAGVRQAAPNAVVSSDPNVMKQRLGLSDQQAQKYAEYVQETQAVAQQADPKALAWWTFAGVILSLLAAIGGGVVGAGPEIGWWRTTETRTTATVVPRPA
jgi:hypothetical protein